MSKIIKAVVRSTEELHAAGHIDDEAMRKFRDFERELIGAVREARSHAEEMPDTVTAAGLLVNYDPEKHRWSLELEGEPEKIAHDYSILTLPIEKGEWRDADERMFRACFVILGQFVEDELGPAQPDSPDDESYRGYRLHFVGDHNKRAIDLWLWYRDELPALVADYQRDVSESFSGEIVTGKQPSGGHPVMNFGQVRDREYPFDYPEQVKDERLRELIDLRRCLWT